MSIWKQDRNPNPIYAVEERDICVCLRLLQVTHSEGQAKWVSTKLNKQDPKQKSKRIEMRFPSPKWQLLEDYFEDPSAVVEV